MISFKSPHLLAGLPEDEPVLLALSGGADSVTLLDLLAKHCAASGATLYAAHVDHMIREQEHSRDRSFCEELAKKYGIEIFVLEADVPKIAQESGESLELAARRVRYEFFGELMARHGIRLLATAHNADDNFETVLFNLSRGTGLRGACGIPPVRVLPHGFAVRPMLGAKKDEILTYCEQNGLRYVTDSTNADDAYSRNRIRLRVIPELKRINPEAARCVSRFCASAALDRDFIEGCAAELIERDGGIKVERLLAAHPALPHRALAIAFERAAGATLEAVHTEALLRLCREGKGFSSVSLPQSFRARLESGVLRFSPDKKETAERENYELKLKTGKNILGRHIILYVSEQNDKNIYKSETRKAIAFDTIIGSLYARPRKSGDKILQNGMHKDLRRLMSAKKIPPELREILPVVCDDAGVLWVPFVGARDGAKSSTDKKILFSVEIV